jgi:DNA-binding transcriptional LysR family regulator
MQAFVATARRRSFSRAATELGISQPALSKAVSDLEADVGYALFDRTTRRVSLTSAGRQFLPSAERVINAYGSAREDLESLAKGRGGRVAIACLPSVAFGFMPRVLAAFAADYPDIIVDLVEQRADQVADSVRSGEVDIGIANMMGEPHKLETTPLLGDRFALICPVAHPLAAKKAIRWRELESVPIIAMTPDSGIWQEIETALYGNGQRLSIRYVAANPATILALAAAGVGVSPLPGLAWPASDDPRLVCRPLIGPSIQRRLLVQRRSDEPMGPAVRLLMPYISAARRQSPRAYQGPA